MIAPNISGFLKELGLSEIQIRIYNYLLTHKFGNINDIKEELNYSYTQVHHNLIFLEEKGLIESSDSKPRIYLKINPKISLTELIDKKFNSLQEKINRLDEELKVQDSIVGRCTREISFYHYSDLNLAYENFYLLLENANQEIIMSSLPPSVLRKLEPALYQAFMRGVHITLYFSDLDFDNQTNYFEEITMILKRIGVYIVQTLEKTCQLIRYNDEVVNMGNILIDENFLNSIIFKEDTAFHIDGFRGPFAKRAKKMLEIKTVKNKIQIIYPTPIKKVLSAIEDSNMIKTRDLSRNSGIGGGRLKEILNFLVREGVIKEHIAHEGVGRPGKYYSTVE
jgi:sugar-specific transcriptional regulator TrmB